MIVSFIITFRETLEAALIVGIILGYLNKTKQTKHNNIVYIGVGAAIVASIAGAILFNVFAGGFSGRAEKIFEGITMIIGAILLTTMILWMMRQKQVASELEKRVATEVNDSQKFGLFSLVFVSVLREGIETVIFLEAASFVAVDNNLLGALIGIIAAIALGYIIVVSTIKVNLKKFFNITGVLLILFAAGLIAHGVHEFQEAQVIPIVAEHVWDINPAVSTDGSYPLLHEKGHIGSIFKGLFGYNGNPNLLEILSYIVYLVFISIIWRKTNKKEKISSGETN